MILPYAMRLLCLSLAAFYLLHTALALLARFSMVAVMRRAELLRPRSASLLLLWLRLFPLATSLVTVVGLCVPSYLWLEPESASERVGVLCMLAGLAGTALCAVCMLRALSIVANSKRYINACEKLCTALPWPLPISSSTQCTRSFPHVLLIAQASPTLALAGILDSRLIVSQNVMSVLTTDQLEAALRHEDAHRISRDNLKRLLMALAPNIFPWPCANGFAALDRRWKWFTECAADDDAAAGDSARALSLASALVAVAKMNARPKSEPAISFLIGNDCDLSLRVERLLQTASKTNCKDDKQARTPSIYRFISIAGGVLVTVGMWPVTLSMVHEALEHLVH